MDPVSALGVAASTVQFLTFAGSLLNKSYEVHRAADGITIEFKELEVAAHTVEQLMKLLRDSSTIHLSGAAAHRSSGAWAWVGKKQPPPTTERERMEIALFDLCASCESVADELLTALNKLKRVGKKKTAWGSFRQALSCIWDEAKIQTLATRLEGYRKEIDTGLLMSIR